jgi:K+-sensing histidine kinase KdpD
VDCIAVDCEPVDGDALDRESVDGDSVDCKQVDRVAVDRFTVDGLALDFEQVDSGGLAGAGLGLSMMPHRPARLERRIGTVIAVQLAVAVGFGALATARGESVGTPAILVALALGFALAGSFDMSLELHRHRFTFTLADSVLVVGFFAVGAVGLGLAAAVGELLNMLVQRHSPLKVCFNVANRLAAATVAGVAFAAMGRGDVHDAAAWAAALAAALCFSILDVVSTATVLSIVEQTRFQTVFVRSVSTGVLATLAAAPIGLIALDLAVRGPFLPLLLAPVALAVALNSRYAVAQRDEHMRFERLFEASARTAGLVALDDALGSLAAEARALGTGIAAVCCATDGNDAWIGAVVDDGAPRAASPEVVAAAVELAGREVAEVDAAQEPKIAALAPDAGTVLVATSQHERAGRIVLLVLRDGSTGGAATNRAETLSAFANHAALIVTNAVLHEERAVALARQIDLNRQKSDFVAAVSHELRTPLAVMLGSVHTLNRLDGRMTDAQREELFTMTVEQGGRLQRLIDELLLVAAAEHSEVALDRDVVQVAELFGSIAADTSASTRGRLVSRIDTSDRVVTDHAKLERILLNLVENAAKYAPDCPIELVAARAGVQTRFSVIDHGPGIPAADRERVFERFVQLDQSSTRRQGGTGLGLHLSRQLADLLGATLSISETPGGGCTFTLDLPLPDDAPAAPTFVPTEDALPGLPGVRVRPDALVQPRLEQVG